MAQLHALESGAQVTYKLENVESFAAANAGGFDIVTCMEMLEHVPDPAQTIAACATLVRPGGLVVFSTINRNPKSYLFAVIGAEYVLRLLPRGTHEYARFIRPSELCRYARNVALDAVDMEVRKALQAVEMDQSGRCSGGTEIPPAADDRRSLGISSLALASGLSRASATAYRFRVWGIAEQVGTTMFNVNDGPGTVSVISSSLGSLSGGELVMVTGSLDTTFTGPTIRARPENIVTLAPAPEGVVYARAPVPAAAPAPELPFDSSRLQGTPDAASSDCGCGSSALPASLIASPGTPRNTSH